MVRGSDPGDLNPHIENPGCYSSLGYDPTQAAPLETGLLLNCFNLSHDSLLETIWLFRD
jgi:hypothetical protein